MLSQASSVSPRLLRVTLGGDELHGYEPGAPAASVRLLLPRPGESSLVLPTWNGNEFLHSDGLRPTIRTYTPRRFDVDRREIDLDVVLHAGGAVPTWLESAELGVEVGIAGPGRGYEIDASATAFVLLGDETAIPAISQLLEHLPRSADVTAHIEVVHADARHELPAHPGATIHWLQRPSSSPTGSTLVAAAEAVALDDNTRIWAAGEAAAMQRTRRILFEERKLPRAQAVVRGYWKIGRGGDATED